MFKNDQIVKNKGYWLDQIQNEIYFQLQNYMENENLNQKGLADRLNVSPSYVSQILNGNFNYGIGKLIDLALAIGMIPKVQFVSIEDELNERKKMFKSKVIHLNEQMSVSDSN